ncbi:hypothetical protein Patl1_22625 [Pistacia atlantica]|uniref:Uncharacterized protein n=1 Tax=Pistacia atlantica TaxID=434234 RepID=A0ACC0ZWW2_9ROSI|nr:hypothetical protein Patl1_22625 [Pistacia atlantica]
MLLLILLSHVESISNPDFNLIVKLRWMLIIKVSL